MDFIELHDINKIYHLGEVDLPVLKGISLRVARGELLALMGASGSGKSTLMNILGCLDRPTSGEYLFDGRAISGIHGKRTRQVAQPHDRVCVPELQPAGANDRF